MLAYEYPFDTCQMPLNVMDGTFLSFEQKVLPELIRQGIAALGMKTFAGNGKMVRDGIYTPEEGLRYAMSLPVATTITGILTLEDLQQNVRIASEFIPMSNDEMEVLRSRVANAAGDGRYEIYKVTAKHDGPVGREQHEFPIFAEVRL